MVNVREMLEETLWDESKEGMAQVLFEVCGFPMQDALRFEEVTEERTGENGRYLVATQFIPAFTWLRVEKVRLVLGEAELAGLHRAFSGFVRREVPELVGFPSAFAVLVQEEELPHGSDMLCFVGAFVRGGLLGDAVVRDLMAYDAFEAGYVQATLARMRLGDALWLHFWRRNLEGEAAADTVWRVFSFILSHAFKTDARMLTFGAFCKAQCPQERWDWYLGGSRAEAEPVRARAGRATQGDALEQLLGNFEEVHPWGAQTTVGAGQVSAAECVVVMRDVAQGAAVEMDYGERYMVEDELQLRQLRGDELERALARVLGAFDARVGAAFGQYMRM